MASKFALLAIQCELTNQWWPSLRRYKGQCYHIEFVATGPKLSNRLSKYSWSILSEKGFLQPGKQPFGQSTNSLEWDRGESEIPCVGPKSWYQLLI